MPPSTDRSLLIVAGSGRSGTSLCSGLVHRLGLHLPLPEKAGNRNNPRGFGEPEWAVDFDRRMLRSVEVGLEDTRPGAWARAAKVAELPAPRAELRDWLAEQFAAADRVVVKDPHLTWITELYRLAADDVPARLTMATMLRHPYETTKSRDLAYGSSASPTSRLAAWVNVMLHLEARTRDLQRAMVRHENLLADWRSTLERADTHLGLALLSRATDDQIKKTDDLVDPTLHRATGRSWEEMPVPDNLRDLAEETWEALGQIADDQASAATYEHLDALRERYTTLYDHSRAIVRSSISAARRDERRTAAVAPPNQPMPLRRATSEFVRALSFRAGRATDNARQSASLARRRLRHQTGR